MVVGLTGGIASGKSIVSAELKKLGAHIIDADRIAREITVPGAPVLEEIVREFGGEYLLPDGALDRKKLGRLVFSDPEKLKRLNEITHPAIVERTKDLIRGIQETDPDALIIVDAAVLIETGLHKSMDKVMVVYADEDKQVEWMGKRDGFDANEAKKRISAQIPLKEKLLAADYIISNDGTVDELRDKVRKIYSGLKGPGPPRRRP